MRHFRDKVFMKVAKCKIHGEDGYVCSYKRDGKYCRKYFYSKKDAEAFKRNIEQSDSPARAKVLALPDSVLEDIISALNVLPQGKTLFQSVKKAWEFDSRQSIHDFLDKFLALKKAKCAAGKLSRAEFSQIKGRVAMFKGAFSSFSEATPQALLAFLLARGRNKTIKNWRATISEFFTFCIYHDAIASNPVQKIHTDEFIKSEEPYKIGFLSVAVAREFLAFIEQRYPHFARFYALAMFAGIRVEEVPRLKDEYFRYDEKKIIFPAQIGKVKKSWTLEDLPENLWAWLEKYKNSPILRPSDYIRTHSFKQFNLPANFARHSFATYHLSLYLDPRRTSMITRNSEQMLRDHYWAALVDKQTAKAYFEILPS